MQKKKGLKYVSFLFIFTETYNLLHFHLHLERNLTQRCPWCCTLKKSRCQN